MTPSKEDYLKVIFELNEVYDKVTNKLIASTLEISPAGVSDMVGKLIKSDLVVKVKGQGFKLTPSGNRIASDMIRKHRMWEVFLHEKLNYDEQDIHSEAEILEHASSEDLIDRLEVYLDHPKYCPHGGVIPAKDTVLQPHQLIKLANCKVGSRVMIKRFVDDQDLLDSLSEKDLVLNQEGRIASVNDYDGTIELEVAGRPVAISEKMAAHIFVTLI